MTRASNTSARRKIVANKDNLRVGSFLDDELIVEIGDKYVLTARKGIGTEINDFFYDVNARGERVILLKFRTGSIYPWDKKYLEYDRQLLDAQHSRRHAA